MRADLKVIGDAVITAVKGYVGAAMAAPTARLDLLDERVAAIPAQVRGERGEKGERGEPGRDGASVTVGELRPSVTEIVEAAIASVAIPKDGKDGAPGERGPAGEPGAKGERGEPGPSGAAGPAGLDGNHGALGLQGLPGEPGKPGEKGLDGREGKDGRDGRDGKDGAPGRDALEIEILPTIDAAKSYARGTFAQFGGGIIRAVRNTDPFTEGGLLVEAGWSFVVRGVSLIDVQQSHERSFEMNIVFNDGAVECKSFLLPVMIYRGTYQEGSFEPGDTVTWGGSLWHCEAPTTDKPGTSQAWKLCVKHGRDGKDK